MNSVLLMVGHVFANESAQMPFIQHDDVVQKLSATASDPPLRESILPGRLDVRPFGRQTSTFQECDHLSIELRVVVEDDVSIWSGFRECLPELLDYPIRTRMLGHVEVDYFSTPVLDYEEAVQHPKVHRRHCEKVERNDHFAVILEEGKPSLRRIAAALQATQISGHTRFGDNEAEF